MSIARKLSDQETAVLKVIGECSDHPKSRTATGDELARTLNSDPLVVRDTSIAGVHQTAASLVRKGLAWRAGTRKLQWYRITEPGRRALKGDMAGNWVAR